MERLTRWMLRHPRKILVAFCLLTLFFGLENRNVRIDPSMEIFIPEGHLEVFYSREVREVFGLFNFVMVGGVDQRDGGILQPEPLQLVKDLSEAFATIPDVIDVFSLYEFPYIEGDAEGMTVKPLYEEVSNDQTWLSSLEEKVRRWPLLVGNLVSRDGKATAILVRYTDIERGLGELHPQSLHQTGLGIDVGSAAPTARDARSVRTLMATIPRVGSPRGNRPSTSRAMSSLTPGL